MISISRKIEQYIKAYLIDYNSIVGKDKTINDMKKKSTSFDVV